MNRIMNKNSLENLNKPKKKREYGYQYKVPEETIDEMFKLLSDGKPLKTVAKELGICYDTAKKYFEKGDPRRGIRPLKLRLEIFQDAVSKEFDAELIERRKELLKIITDAIDEIKNEITAGNLKKKASYNQLSTLVRLELFLRGGVVEKREKTFGLLTAEDIRGAAESEKKMGA